MWAHPDDETYLAGGLLAALRDVGQRVVCVTATRGEAAVEGAGEQDRDQLARLRTAELTEAMAVLCVEEHRWLGYADGGCRSADPEQAVERLRGIVEQVRPDTVLTFGPDGFTGHPDHVAVGAWAGRAVQASSCRPRVLHAVMTHAEREAFRDLADGLGVYALGEPRLCHEGELAIRLELRGDQLARKVAALRCQASQTEPVMSIVGVDRFAEWVSVETFADGE